MSRESGPLSFDLLMSSIRDGIVIINREGRVMEANQGFIDLLGYGHAELQNLPAWDWHAAMTEQEIRGLFSAPITGLNRHFTTTYRHKNGRVLEVEVRATGILIDGQEALVCLCRDITESRQAQQALRESSEKYRSFSEEYKRVFNGIQDAMFLVEIGDQDDFHFVRTNKTLQEKTGLTPDQTAGKSPREVFGPEKGRIIEDNYRRCLRKRKPITYEETLDLSAGKRIWQTTLTPVFQDAQPVYIVGLSRDITLSKKYENKLQFLSLHDPLTGLYNRTFFEEEMKRLQTGRDYPISIIVVDLDGLKAVNDNLGHARGDELLKRCAEILRQSLRSSDILARVGGDEFTVLLPATDTAVSRDIVNRLRSNVNEYNEQEHELPLSISIGVATAEKKNSPLEVLYRIADDRMYLDKISRRGPDQPGD